MAAAAVVTATGSLKNKTASELREIGDKSLILSPILVFEHELHEFTRIMTTEERIRKALKKVSSAIVHVKALTEVQSDADTWVGDLKRVRDGLHAMNYRVHHEGKTITQMELF